MITGLLTRWKLVIVTAAAAFLFCTEPSISAAFKNVQVAQVPPAFALKDLAGKEWKSEDLLAGKVTAVIFWATWSPRSADVIRDLEALRTAVGPDKLQVVTVNCEHPTISAADRQAIGAAAKDFNLSGPVLVDDGLVAFNAYGAMALPSTLLLGEDGKVAYVLAGYPTTLREELADAVRKAAGIPTEADQRPVQEYVPKNRALMYYNLGRQLASKGQDEKAESQLRTSIEKDPDFKKARVELGLLLKRSGNHAEALEQFKKAREIDPKDVEALFQLAMVSLQTAQFEEAQKLFAELRAEFPEREELALGAAFAAKYLGKEEEYRADRDAAAKLFPAEARHVYELGGVAESQKDEALAAEFYRRAIEAALAKK